MVEIFSQFAGKIGIGLLHPVYNALFSGTVRFFWLYLLTGLLLAAWVHHKQRRQTPFTSKLFAPEVWTSQSAINDYYILLINSVFKVFALSWVVSHLQTVTHWFAQALYFAGVKGQTTTGDSIALGLALTVCLFLARDFMRFYMHYLMHRLPVLWEFHKVHHSAEVLNFATSERHHPVDIVFTTFLMLFVTALVNGIFIAFFGDTLTVLSIAGANGFWVVGNLFGGILRHSPFPVSFGRVLENWLISPAMHQIHHSDSPEHFDSNMGGTLAVWDRIWGTHTPAEGQVVKGFGIGAETKAFRSLENLYFKPFITVYHRLRGEKNFYLQQ